MRGSRCILICKGNPKGIFILRLKINYELEGFTTCDSIEPIGRRNVPAQHLQIEIQNRHIICAFSWACTHEIGSELDPHLGTNLIRSNIFSLTNNAAATRYKADILRLVNNDIETIYSD